MLHARRIDFGRDRDRTSPDEVVMAWFAAVASDIDAAADVSKLNEWRVHMLTTPVTFIKLPDISEIGWRAAQLRENVQANLTLARTAVQKVFDLATRRQQYGMISPKSMYDLYTSKIVSSGDDKGNGERVTLNFIEKAFTIWDKALKRKDIQDVVLAEESERQTSMFNSIYGMYALVTKSKTDDGIAWVFHSIRDGRLSGNLVVEHMSLRSLDGKVAGSGGKGLVDLVLYKKAVLSHFLTSWLPVQKIPNEIKTKIHETCIHHCAIRKALGFKTGTLPDLTWQAGWPASAVAILSLIEDTLSQIASPSFTIFETCFRVIHLVSRAVHIDC
jgi:hypothetical protein